VSHTVEQRRRTRADLIITPTIRRHSSADVAATDLAAATQRHIEAIRVCSPCPSPAPQLHDRINRAAISATVAAPADVRRCVVWLDDPEQYLDMDIDGLTADLVTRMTSGSEQHAVVWHIRVRK
jgi:hypothetical protein